MEFSERMEGRNLVEVRKSLLFCQALVGQDITQLSQISSVINSFYGKEGYPPLTVVEDELKVRVNQVLKLYKECLIPSVLNVCF